MDFTRDPIIETIITPKDGCKLVIRSSKNTGQEEYFVDAVEVVSFGTSLFSRSLERPKAYLVPVSDYEVVEVREARMVLKNVGPERSIKIAGGRDTSMKVSREEKLETAALSLEEESESVRAQEVPAVAEPAISSTEARPDARLDKKRDRRRHYRKRRGGRAESVKDEEGGEITIPPLEEDKVQIQPPEEGSESIATAVPLSSNLLSSLLQPPPTLISETINRYRENALFKSAFFLSEEDQFRPHDKTHNLLNEDDEELAPILQAPTYESESEHELEQPEEMSMPGMQEEQAEGEQYIEELDQLEALEEAEEVEGQGFTPEDFEALAEEPLLEQEESEVNGDLGEDVSLPLYAEEEDPVANDHEAETEKQEEDPFLVIPNSEQDEETSQ